LKEAGHMFQEIGPSYLIHIAEEDPHFPAGLNGRFHGLLADLSSGAATLFNDRYGLHRVYYHEAKDVFYFASEAKAILAVLPEVCRADIQSVGEFISCGCVLENRTLFESIHVLPPASAWVFRNGFLESKRSYFNPEEWEAQEPLEQESYYRALRDVFSSNLPRYFTGEQTIGMSLTAGLDSRLIMAWQNCSPRSLPCYTFGGSIRDCKDVLGSRRVAEACEQPHQVIRVGQEFLSIFPKYAERTVYLSDGCASVNRAADLYINQKARDIAPVRMTGNYGSEVLRRVRAFKPSLSNRHLFRHEFLAEIDLASSTYSRLRSHPVSFVAFQQAPWYHYGLLALEETQLSVRTPYLDNDLVKTVFRSPALPSAANINLCLRLIADGKAGLHKIATDRGFAGNRRRLFNASYMLSDFTFKAEYAYDTGMPQWLAQIDHWISPLHFDRLFLGRHKFTHFRIWYRDRVSKYVREMLLDSMTLSRPYFKPKELEGMVSSHLKGVRNYTTEIHQALTLELVHRLFLNSR
jgi:asparagine synthase (glutamine-hydrolysing)